MTNTNEITFEINGATYTRKANGYCYVSYEYSESGKIHRIGKTEFEAKYAQFQTEKDMEEAVEVEITELEPREGEKVYHDEPIEYTDIEAAVEATEESVTTEEIKEIAKELAPKKKRTRKSKDVAFAVTVDGVEITLTAKQVDFIRHLPDTCFWEHGLDSAAWTDVLADEIGGQFAGKPMTTGAMISTLCEKGLAVRGTDRVNGRKATFMELTGLGKVIAAELGLA